MEWQDEGFILERRAHGESAAILSVLTLEHGRHAGLIHGGQSPKKTGLLQCGNHVRVTWRGRLLDHLGTYEAEILGSNIGNIIGDAGRCAALQSATALMHLSLPEREPQPELFDAFRVLSEVLGGEAWAPAYVFWELGFLRCLGFSIDLSACAVTGSGHNLTHVSPRSGRAVSNEGAGEFRDRLLKLPPFLTGGMYGGVADVIDGLTLTGHFLERHVTSIHNQPLPAARLRLMDVCRALRVTSG